MFVLFEVVLGDLSELLCVFVGVDGVRYVFEFCCIRFYGVFFDCCCSGFCWWGSWNVY